jgi:cell division protein ZipA
MNTLAGFFTNFWVLAFLVIVAAVTAAWLTRRQRKPVRRRVTPPRGGKVLEMPPSTDRRNKEDIDREYEAETTRLDSELDPLEFFETATPSRRRAAPAESAEAAPKPDAPEKLEKIEKPARPAKPKAPPELIIALLIQAPPGEAFKGADIMAAMEDVGLQYGAMQIFHHHGIEGNTSKQAVFSVANLVEPGTLDPARMEEFTSPGLAIFMRLPGPLSGRVAFELMLNNAYRLAELLDGELLDGRRQPLDPPQLAELRGQIENFERGGRG